MTVRVSFVLLVKQRLHSIKTEDFEGQLETGQGEACIVFVLVSLLVVLGEKTPFLLQITLHTLVIESFLREAGITLFSVK